MSLTETLRICVNADLPEKAIQLLEAGVGPHEIVFAKEKVPLLQVGGPCDELSDADVAFGQPDPAQLLDNPHIRFIQITSAGYTRYDTPEFKKAMVERKVAFCNSSSLYSDPCAQHVLAFMLAWARQIPRAVQIQDQTCLWSADELRPITRLLRGDKVAIVGYGAIGERLAEILKPFHLDVVGIRRTVRGNEPIPCYSNDRLDEFLATADHVVNIVPANAQNHHFFDRRKFGLMKNGAVFYNIGRGTTVDQEALIEALSSGPLAAALLDVATPEPLPPDHPLWSAPNCTITPHIGGGFADERVDGVQHFLDNLKRFEKGEPLVDRVF